jgi:hypothetical protein
MQTLTALRADAPHSSERPSAIHTLKVANRKKIQAIITLLTANGNTLTTQRDIHFHFREYFQRLKDTIATSAASLHAVGDKITQRLPNEVNTSVLAPITLQELRHTVNQGARNKSLE